MPATLPSILSAVAATIAAVLAAITLHVTGRREHRRWLRESLVESYLNYLNASFDAPGSSALTVRQPAALAKCRREAAEAHDRQLATLTRLRVIAPQGVVKAAEALHEADHAVTVLALKEDATADDAWNQSRDEQWSARSTFVDQARRSLGLSLGTPIGHRP
jgi:hypothetical protein